MTTAKLLTVIKNAFKFINPYAYLFQCFKDQVHLFNMILLIR
jgi:hypothetical protein